MNRKLFLLGILTLVVSGCAPLVTTSVASFHEISNDLTGQTFSLVPSKEQDGGLEYKTYALLVKQQLEQKGLKEAQLNEAKYAVTMAYGVDNGRPVSYSYPIYGQTGVSGARTSGTVSTVGSSSYVSATTTYTPTYGVVGTGVSSSTTYTRYVNLQIIDLSKSMPGKTVTVYEGKATSEGVGNQLSTVMPAIIRSVFKDFPGKSGATRTVVESLDD